MFDSKHISPCWLVVTSLACSNASPPAPPAVVPPTVVIEQGAPQTSALAQVRFWVAKQGLEAYDLDGKLVARLGELPVDHVRRLVDGRFVALAYGRDGESLELLVLDADARLVERLPLHNSFEPTGCRFTTGPAADDGLALDLQDPRDFFVTETSVCLHLQDRNDNMSSYELDLGVDIATWTSVGRMSLDIEGECEGEGFSQGGRFDCAYRVSEPWIEPMPADPPAQRWPFAYDQDTGWLMAGADRVAQLCLEPGTPETTICSSIESESPSGRWTLLDGRWTEGDYIYRDLVLLDRSTGTLLEIDGTTFIEVAAAQVFRAEGEEPWVLTLMGESESGWMPGDRLWVDGLLLIPERREVVEVGGTRVGVPSTSP